MIHILRDIKVFDVIDVALVAFILYEFIVLIQGTRAKQILLGLSIFFVPLIISPWIQLTTIIWIVERVLPIGLIALLIIFQPEFRRGLERLGRGSLFGARSVFMQVEELENLIHQIRDASLYLSNKKIGALIVITRETHLEEYIESGVRLRALCSPELLINIFVPKTPLHDGAVILTKNVIEAASCILPLSDSPKLDQSMGMRHRAALGITEISDALAVVVSEETGSISIAANGKINRGLDSESLERNLKRMLRGIVLPQTSRLVRSSGG